VKGEKREAILAYGSRKGLLMGLSGKKRGSYLCRREKEERGDSKKKRNS